MKSYLKDGEARRARVAARRRAVAFAPQILERLESRQLLAAGNLGINVEISPYTSFVNWLQVPGTWTANPGQSNTVTLNSSGDPNSDATLLFDDRVNQSFNGPDPNAVGPNLSGTYHLSFNGQATIEQEYPYFSTPFTVQNQVYNATTNTTTADLVVPSNNSADFFGITFANTQATATSSVDTGFSNARLIRPGYSANSTQLYTNEFLAALTPYNTLRYLDPENTNGQPYYNGNTLVTVNASQVDQTGLPWEYLVTLANQTNTDMWINIPQGATDDYVAAVAGIIKNGGTVNGVTYAGLNPNLKIYVEYSNEVWGGIPGNENYQAAAVQNSASNQPLSTFPGNQDIYQNSDGTTTTDVYTALGRRYLERTAEIGQIFQSVLGADPTHQHIRPVLGWQENNSGFYPPALSWFETYFGSASAAFYGMGNADYWGPTDYSSVDAVISSLQAQETSYAIPNAIDFTTIATYYGLKNVSYEGGPSISGDPSTAAGQVALAASRDPRMEALVYQHYIDYFEDGGALANYFDGPFGILTPSNEWPIAELNQYGDPSSSPRYEGTVDLANAAPVAVTAGILVAPSSPTTFTASTDTLGTSLSNPTSGEQGFWLLNATSTETYDLALSTTAVVGKTPGQFEVFLNDKPVGGLFIQGSQSTIDLGNLSLSAGINTLSILIVTPGSQFQPSNFTLTPSQSLPTIADNGFENESVGYANYVYNPVSTSWNFTGSSGVTGNNSGFTSGNPAAPEGSQVAFLQDQGEISQVVPAWAAGSYVVTFLAAERDNNGMSTEDFELLIDGVVVGTFKPSGATYLTYTSPTFTVTAGSHTIAFLGLDTVGGDNSAFLDSISVTAPPPPVPPPVNGIPVVSDDGFENESVGYANYVYNPVSTSWTFTGSSGVTGNNSGFTSGNPAAPEGSQVAFLQDQGEISQVVPAWAAGSYVVTFLAAERDNNGLCNEDFDLLIDGIVVGTFKPSGATYLTYTSPTFTVTAGSHTIAFLGLDTVGGDNSAFLDSISVTAPPPPVPPPVNGIPVVSDSGFEAETVGYANYVYNPVSPSWSFTGSSGVTGNNSGFTSGNPAAPEGSQVAFLQDQGEISQVVPAWAAGSYTISFSAAQRDNNGLCNEDFDLLIDGIVVGTFKPSGATYLTYTSPTFTVTAGSHTIAFLGLDTVGGDNSAFLDSISVTAPPPPVPPPVNGIPVVSDSGFEAETVGYANYVYNPVSPSWSFTGSSGVTGNNSGFTSGNPAAPEGSQVAFLQDQGEISQVVPAWAAGSYTISFSAAQRDNNGLCKEDFEILVDGILVGTFKPTGASYLTYSTLAFAVGAGSHTITFVGLDTVGGDNSAFLDNIAIS